MYIPEIVVGIIIGAVGVIASLIVSVWIYYRRDKKDKK